MPFKLYSDSQVDHPMICCEVCGEKIMDVWSAKATGTRGSGGQVTDIAVHHAACAPPAGAVTIALIDFLRLFAIKNRIGDLGSDGITDKLCVEYPSGKGFEL